MKGNKLVSAVLTLAALLFLSLVPGAAQGPENPQALLGARIPTGSAFTYQGYLASDGEPVDDSCDFQFSLYDDLVAGTLVAGPLEQTGVSVTSGYFTALLDFGGVFDGTALWLEIAVQCSGDAGHTTLAPRQELTAAPYAAYSQAAPWGGIAGMPAGFADGVDDEGTNDHGALIGLGDDDHPQYFHLNQAETVLGRPAFDGGTISAPPFTVDSTYQVANLNADLLDGLHANDFAPNSHDHWGENWSGSGTGLALSGGTVGLYGSDSSTAVYADGVDYGVYALSTDTGVYAEADTYGVYGEGVTAGVFGVAGGPANGYGVYGFSYMEAGVYGYNHTGGYGVVGHSHASGVGVSAWSPDARPFEAYDGEYPTGVLRFYITNAGNVYADGTYNTFAPQPDAPEGNTKYYALSAIQSPESWFEDFGTGALVEGEAIVEIEPTFAGTVNLAEETYHVFLTPLGDCALYVAEQTPTHFTVRAIGGQSCSISFHYRIVAKQLGYEDSRLDVIDIPAAEEVAP